MKKTSKKRIALFAIIVLIASIIPFKVFATNNYTYTIRFEATGNHTIAPVMNGNTQRDGEIAIDGMGNIVAIKNGETSIGAVSVANDGKSATITVTNGPKGKIQYNGDAYSLFIGNSQVANDTEFTDNVTISVSNPQSQNPPPANNGNYNVNFGTATWNVNNVNVTASVAEKTINTSSNVVITDNDVITLTGFDDKTMEVRIAEQTQNENPFSTTLFVETNNNVVTTKLANHDPNTNVPVNLNFTIQPKGQNVENFDGQAYWVWTDNQDRICYHKFTNLQGLIADEPNRREYAMNYINVNELTDQSGNNTNYVWGQEPANWVLATDMEDENGDILSAEDLTKAYVFGDGMMDMGVQLDPTGAENGANSLCSNADRNFRATIIRDGYAAIKFSSSEDDYTYFPSFWDPTFFSSTVDVSGTTAENPAVYMTYLLEPTITFSNDQFTDVITNVEALNVNPNALEIKGVDGIWTIKFNSNYYDNVVFKVTAGGKDYFVKIGRIVINVHDNFGPNTVEDKLIAELFYSKDKSYNDYDVVATVIYNDGTSENKILSASEIDFADPNDENRAIDEYRLNGGKGLYSSQYIISVDRMKLVGAYFTVIKKGALTGDNYGGTFSGSGKGSYYNAETRRIEL